MIRSYNPKWLLSLSSAAGLILTIGRLGLIVAGEQWNNDIPHAILPALHCWYCNPVNAPYGILWYAVDYPLSFLGPQIYIISVFVIDGLIMTRLKGNLLIVYGFMSFWIGIQAPYDIPILWLSLLGMIAFPLTFVGLISKLPFTYDSWQYALHRHYLFSDFQYYALMGVVFIAVLVASINSYVKNQHGQSGLQGRSTN